MKHSPPDSHDHQTGLLDQEIENRILHGLALEWESALGILPHSHSACMKKPVFSLKDSEKSLAHWDAVRREISFSRMFVKSYPWDAVREVLVHEMAHQYAHEVLVCRNETAHGPAFQKACRILRANPNASGSYRPLTDRVTESEQSDGDKTLLKIRKLLALGESKNRFEAQSALSKARELMDKFDVSVTDPKIETSFISIFVGAPSLRRFKEDYLLARLLTDHYKVFGIWVSAYVIDKGKMGRVFEITGRPENVKTAAYVHDFIVNQMNMAWASFNTGNRLNRYRKSDFAYGLIQGFCDGLDQDKKKQRPVPSARTDLVETDGHDPVLMDYAANKYPRIRRFKRQTASGDDGVRQKGREIGEKLVLSKAIEQNDAPKRLPLPPHTT